MRPIAKASSAAMRPAGMGRVAVRFIFASMSRSYHMLIAAPPPEPSATESSTIACRNGFKCPGATHIPAAAVKTTSDITPGLSRVT